MRMWIYEECKEVFLEDQAWVLFLTKLANIIEGGKPWPQEVSEFYMKAPDEQFEEDAFTQLTTAGLAFRVA